MAMHVLIVEDDPALRETISDYFGSKGWQITEAANGEDALEKVTKASFQLILLDVMLPKLNGFAVCRRIRERSDVPVIFITARVMEEDELNGYSLGADAYVTKPFSLPVLYAKSMSLMSRVRGEAPFQSLRRGDLEADFRKRQILAQGAALPLAPREYEMLLFFMENPNRVFSREQLLIRFWGYDFEGNERVVDNHIKMLRKAMERSKCSIRTFRKSGYCLEVTE